MQAIDRIDKIAENIEKPIWFISWIILAFITFLSFIIVILRYGFGMGYLWMDELCRYGFVTIIYLWAGPIVRENGHLQLDFFLKHLSDRWQHFHSAIVNLIQFGICLFFIKYGISLIKISILLDESTESFFFKVWWLHLLIGIGIGFLSIFSFLQLAKSSLLFINYKK